MNSTFENNLCIETTKIPVNITQLTIHILVL